MGAHEKLETVLGLSSRKKLAIAGVALIVIACICAGFIFIGYRWAKSNAEAERTAQDDRIAVLTADGERHLANVTQLAAENALLKKQNEAAAEVLAQADTKRERRALENQMKIDAERSKQFGDIDADQNFDSQVKATCAEYKARGFKLSFCERFEVK